MVLALLFCCIIFFNPVIGIRQQPPSSAHTTASAAVPTRLLRSSSMIGFMCSYTLYPELCLTSIVPFYNGKSDSESVVGMLLKAQTNLTKTAATTATKIAADPKYSHDPAMVNALRNCQEIYYDKALNHLKQAMDALLAHDLGKVDDLVDSATLDYDDCDDGLTWPTNPSSEAASPVADEQSGGISPVADVVPRISPMADIYDELLNLGDVIGDIIFNIQHPSS